MTQQKYNEHPVTQEELDKTVSYLKKTTIKSKGRILCRKTITITIAGITYKDTTLDQYYLGLVNDSLWLIRHQQPCYIFNMQTLKDILRFEPDIEVALAGNKTYRVYKTEGSDTLGRKIVS